MPKAAPHYNPTKGLPRRSKHNDNARKRQAKREYTTYSKTWRAIRAEHLADEPLCRACMSEGIRRPGSHVDHIDGDDSNNEPGNLQTLCASHHSQKTARTDGGFGNDRRP